MPLVKGLIGRSLCSVFLLFFFKQLWATAYQPFLGIAYENPANLYTINKIDVILGNTYIQERFVFSGSNGALTGHAISDRNRNLPHGRLAFRVTKKLIVGVDISHRLYLNIQFPVGSILQSSSTASTLFDLDYSPRFSYQINEKLIVGAGANLNNLYQTQLNFVVDPYGNLVNKGSGWAYGWNAGLIYKFNEKNILNLNYYSEINHGASGVSTWGPVVNPNLQFFNTIIPANLTCNLYKVWTEKIASNVEVHYQFWNKVQTLSLTNTALGINLDIPLYYHNALVAVLNGRYKFNDQLTGIIGGEYNTNPAEIFNRHPGLPASAAENVYTGVEISFNKEFTIKFLYSHGFASPAINTIGQNGPIVGKEKINANIADLFLIWHF